MASISSWLTSKTNLRPEISDGVAELQRWVRSLKMCSKIMILIFLLLKKIKDHLILPTPADLALVLEYVLRVDGVPDADLAEAI